MIYMLKFSDVFQGGNRQSNLELLRIIAMLLVMVVHANFFSLGSPSIEELHTFPQTSITRFFIQSIGICCVNIFVLISGYFGIRPKFISLVSFLYQILFFFVLIYAMCIAMGYSSFNLQGLLQCVGLTSSNWFIKAYLLLFILAPVLNAFVDMGNQQLHRNILIGFYLMQTIYGCLFAADFFNNGYSTLSFIGLYLLARYIRLYTPKFAQLNRLYDALIYLFCAIAITVISILGLKIGKNTNLLMFTYINPLVIVESVALLLYFSKLNFTSRVINWVAASSFAVYLLHANPNILKGFFKETILLVYNSSTGVLSMLCILIFLLTLFVASILFDQIRKITYEFISKEIRNR